MSKTKKQEIEKIHIDLYNAHCSIVNIIESARKLKLDLKGLDTLSDSLSNILDQVKFALEVIRITEEANSTNNMKIEIKEFPENGPESNLFREFLRLYHTNQLQCLRPFEHELKDVEDILVGIYNDSYVFSEYQKYMSERKSE